MERQMGFIRVILVILVVYGLVFSSCSSDNGKTTIIKDSDDSDDDDDNNDDDDNDNIDDDTSTSEVWTDPSTGLMWQNTLDVGSPDLDWSDASAYCSNLGAGGYTDWRLPTISELRSLIRGCSETVTGGICAASDGCRDSSCNDQCSGCEFDEGPDYGSYWPSELSGTPACWYWSSSLVADIDQMAWVVYFSAAAIYCDYMYSPSAGNCARCVR